MGTQKQVLSAWMGMVVGFGVLRSVFPVLHVLITRAFFLKYAVAAVLAFSGLRVLCGKIMIAPPGELSTTTAFFWLMTSDSAATVVSLSLLSTAGLASLVRELRIQKVTPSVAI